MCTCLITVPMPTPYLHTSPKYTIQTIYPIIYPTCKQKNRKRKVPRDPKAPKRRKQKLNPVSQAQTSSSPSPNQSPKQDYCKQPKYYSKP